MDKVELLIGIAEIATALAGFTGVVVAFGSRSLGTWSPGDRLRLGFLLEASLTAAGFALAALLGVATWGDTTTTWATMSSLWALVVLVSLWWSHRGIAEVPEEATDKTANSIVTTLFLALVVLSIANAALWQSFAPFLAGITLNLTGAALQFSRLIRSAFHE